jgi:hypothetical protein
MCDCPRAYRVGVQDTDITNPLPENIQLPCVTHRNLPQIRQYAISLERLPGEVWPAPSSH